VVILNGKKVDEQSDAEDSTRRDANQPGKQDEGKVPKFRERVAFKI
jgi:hypothetical protein